MRSLIFFGALFSKATLAGANQSISITEKEITLLTDQIRKGYAYPATDEGANRLVRDLR